MPADEVRPLQMIEVRPGYFRDYQFLTLPDAGARLTPADGRRLVAAYKSARDDRGPVYLEHGSPPPA